MRVEPVDREDVRWNRVLDNLTILMALTIAKVVMKQWKGSKRIGELINGRLDKLIRVYKDPNA